MLLTRLLRSHRPLAGLVALLAFGLATSAPAGSFNVGDARAHDDWHSLVLRLGDERHARAIEQHSYADSVFSVNATPGACDRPWLALRVELGEVQAESATVNRVPADLLIDRGWVHQGQADFITERGDSGFYVRFTLPDTDAVLDEIRDGDTLRLRIHRAEDDYWFLVLSLNGADAALTRMETLCRAE
ncbi:DUF1176 domain-containing protein [Halomonas getboli]|uniref:DUF1176 domain-containing protein n=1 Tax=Halomonas getboli TaxID=2935862 RepID=UPI001FFFED3D|nr:DUF1176 domain-containing protein [Halomonas getboli]MCK2185140.1 DUF1176 domain-containing protein [Halomonas getboli]